MAPVRFLPKVLLTLTSRAHRGGVWRWMSTPRTFRWCTAVDSDGPRAALTTLTSRTRMVYSIDAVGLRVTSLVPSTPSAQMGNTRQRTETRFGGPPQLGSLQARASTNQRFYWPIKCCSAVPTSCHSRSAALWMEFTAEEAPGHTAGGRIEGERFEEDQQLTQPPSPLVHALVVYTCAADNGHARL